MTKQEIIDLERVNSDKIHLFLEGSFRIAYEKSAFRFVQSVRPYRVRKKWIKIVGCEVASLGFPAAALDAIVSECKLEIVEQTGERITLRAPDPLTEEDFDLWKADVELFVPKQKPQPERPEPELKENAYGIKPHCADVPDSGVLTAIVHRIRNFSVENSTPMDCMFFVAELKRQIREYPHNEAQP